MLLNSFYSMHMQVRLEQRVDGVVDVFNTQLHEVKEEVTQVWWCVWLVCCVYVSRFLAIDSFVHLCGVYT